MRQAIDSLEGEPGPTRILTGTIIGARFRIESLLAREGGSTLYRAADVQSGAPVALRVIPLTAITNGVDRLIADVERTQALRHKNLVDVEAVGREGDFVFVASELVDGQSLRAFIDGKRADGRGVSLKGASNLVAHVANALDYAKRATVHGALSPAIIWVNRTGRVKVSALGLAAGVPGLSRYGAPAGTADTVYMAPEVLGGGDATTVSDVYALGVILYELLTGHPPGNPFMRPSAVVAEVPPAVDGVVERALHRDPDARWPSVMALKDALQAAAGLVTGDARGSVAGPAAPAMSLSLFPPGAMSVSAKAAQAAAPTLAVPAQPSRHSAPGAGAPGSGPGPKSSSPVVVAVGSPEDGIEQWLIQKDRLDFGPFSMTQVRAQIERGEILPDHMLVDNDSGARCKVKEYPGLGDLTKVAHRRLEQVRRAQAEQRSAKSEKKKSFATTMVVGLVLVAVLGGVGFYVLSRRDSAEGRLSSREEEAEIESFLKGVKIGGMKASVRRGGHRSAGSASGGPAEDFNNDANFGDASKGFAEGDQTLDDDQIQSTMMSNYRKLIPCIVHSGVNEIAMEFVVRGTGKVSAVKVNGQRTGTLPGCLLGRMQSFNFPKFNGSKTIASWSMSMGR
ncbi:MAG: serine/threonine protein kinase [Deltaproteobacteria bacterium]|nr:serine/threonine protein kinase [Deltaproteobacteria bacterium]